MEPAAKAEFFNEIQMPPDGLLPSPDPWPNSWVIVNKNGHLVGTSLISTCGVIYLQTAKVNVGLTKDKLEDEILTPSVTV